MIKRKYGANRLIKASIFTLLLSSPFNAYSNIMFDLSYQVNNLVKTIVEEFIWLFKFSMIAALFLLVCLVILRRFVDTSESEYEKFEKKKPEKPHQVISYLSNKAWTLQRTCQIEKIDCLSFELLHTESQKLYKMIDKNQESIGADKIRKFINNTTNIYLPFMDEYGAILGSCDESQRSKVESVIQKILFAIKEARKVIVDDKILGIEVKGDVIDMLNKGV